MSRVRSAIAAAGAAARRCWSGAPTRAYQITTAGGHPRRALALALTLLMIGSVFAPIAATGIGAAQQSPTGLEAAPDDNFNARESAAANPALENVPTHAAAWDVHASAWSTDLETTVDTTGDRLVLEFSDDRNHQAREVAIAATALEDSLGERPATAFGLHESGDRWTSEIDYRDGYAVFEIPKFSTNDVTFEGSVELTGSPSTDGTSYTYELADSEDASDFNVTLTGSTHRANETVAQKAGDGDSIPYDVDGTTAPDKATLSITGTVPSDNYNAEWTDDTSSSHAGIAAEDGTTYVLTDGAVVYAYNQSDGTRLWSASLNGDIGRGLAVNGSDVYASTDEYALYELSASDGTVNWNVSTSTRLWDLDAASGTVYGAGHLSDSVLAYSTADGSQEWEATDPGNRVVRVATNPSNSTVYSVDRGGVVRAFSTADGMQQWTTDVGADPSDRVGFQYMNGNVYSGSSNGDVHALDTSNSGGELWTVNYSIGDINWMAGDGEYLFGSNENDNGVVAIDPSDGREAWSESDTAKRLTYDGALYTAEYSAGGVDRRTVYAESEDPAVAIDGTTQLSHSGRLEYGTTKQTSVSLDLGSNTLDVSMTGLTAADVNLEIEEITETVDPMVEINGDKYDHLGTLADGETTSLSVSTTSLKSGTNRINVSVSESYDGPLGQVGMDYSHTATDAQSVDYEGETFSERYNVSKTYASDRTGEVLSIPWSGNVIGVRDLELRRDGGSWTKPSYSMSNGTLEVEIGSVTEGETVDIRTTGTKVDPKNGNITVTDPTVLGDDLSSEIKIDDYSSGFRIAVDGTLSGNETHYTHSESWSNPQTYARVQNDGAQSLYFPNAGAGSKARISTIPLEPKPQDGHVDVRVRSTGSEPEFKVLDSSSTSSVDLVWYDTVSGSTYQLYSLSTDSEVDRATANSPVTLTHDGNSEILTIYQLGSGSGGSASGATGMTSSQPLLLIALVIAGLLAIYVVSRRMGDESVSGGMLLVAGSVIVALLSIQAMAPGILARAIGSGLESAMPILLLGAIGIIIVWLRSRGDDVQLNIRGR